MAPAQGAVLAPARVLLSLRIAVLGHEFRRAEGRLPGRLVRPGGQAVLASALAALVASLRPRQHAPGALTCPYSDYYY